MIAASADFVCAADEVWRLQRGSEADCVVFQRLVNGGERITDKGSRQGTWVLAPGAGVLARCNTRDPERVLDVLAHGLEAWEALDAAGRRLPAGLELEPAHRWEHGYPEGGLVLERIARELAGEGPDAPRSARWNRDFAWFSAAEVAELVPGHVAPGDTIELELLADRLARFHLVDDVRGQSQPYAPAEVGTAALRARVTSRAGLRVELELSGSTAAESGATWLLGDNLWKPRRLHPHGIECRLAGTAVFDLESGAFTHFDLVALAGRWGRTQLNGRGRDDAPGRIAFHLQLAPDGVHLPPTFVALYDVDWITAPAVPTWRDSPAECGLEER